MSRIVAGAFELSHLPNRAELRLKSTGKVIGYTLSQVRDPRGRITGATLFFKDLTRVEQLEERERLRDRLAALGEMAAAIAHEVKNPLAGIEVMAGVLKRQLPESEDAQSILRDIIKEAKMANAIVLEVLDFVRPIRLQVERVSLADVVRDAISMAESHIARGQVQIQVVLPEDLAPIQGDPHQLRQLFTNLLTNAFEALGGTGLVAHRGQAAAGRRRAVGRRRDAGADDPDRSQRRRSGDSGGRDGADLQSVLHDEAAGVRARTGDRPQDRRRARRAHRRQRPRPRGARASGSRCRSAAATSCSGRSVGFGTPGFGNRSDIASAIRSIERQSWAAFS